MFYTLGTAAKATGKSKGAVLFSIRKGRISAKKDELGRYQIDPAELARIYPITQLGTLKTERDETQETVYENRELKARLEGLQRLCLAIETECDDLRADRDHWRQQATAVIADLRAELEPPRASLLQRLFGRKAA